jgi:ankyrin repeat protein
MNDKRILLGIFFVFLCSNAPLMMAMEQNVQVQNNQSMRPSEFFGIFKEQNTIAKSLCVVKKVQKMGSEAFGNLFPREEPKMTADDLFWLCRQPRKDLPEVAIKGHFSQHVHARDDYGKTPLHHAAANGFINMVKSLVNDEADLNAFDTEYNLDTLVGGAPLHYAAQNGHLEVVKFLIDSRADIYARDSCGCTLLHYAVNSLRDNSEMINFVIKKYPESVNVIDNFGETPLHIAVSCSLPNNRAIIRILLENGANANIQERRKYTPIYYAQRCYDAIKILVEYGADVNTRISNSGWTPLFYAIDKNDAEFIKLVMEKKPDIYARDICENTVLHYAVLRSTPEMVQYLLDNGCKALINAKDGMEQSPLYAACRNGKYENAKILLEYGADVNIKGVRLFEPKLMSKEDCTRMIWRDPNAIKPEIEYFHIGARIWAEAQAGWTPLHIASHNGHDKIIDLLIKYGADVNIKADDNVTSLHVAAFGGHATIVKKLSDAGADVNVETIDINKNFLFDEINGISDKVTPLFLAIQTGKNEVVEILAPLSKINNAVGSFNATPLHYASLLGHFNIVKTLIKNGAQFMSLIWGKHTAADIASYYNKKDIATFLMEKVDSFKQMARGNNNQKSIAIIKNNSVMQKAVNIQPKNNIRADLPLIKSSPIQDQLIKTAFDKYESLGIHYCDKNGQIKCISSIKSKNGLCMMENHLSDLDYSYCPKMKNKDDIKHNFGVEIEKQFGKFAYIFIESKDIDKINDMNKKMRLYATMPGKIDTVEYKNRQQHIIKREKGVFEFEVKKNLYKPDGICYHRFFNPKGIVGAQEFGAKARAKQTKKITL